MTTHSIQDILQAPHKSTVDDIIAITPTLFSFSPQTRFQDLTLWHFIASWDTLDWFYFEMAMRKATNDRLGCEKWLGQVYSLDIEHTPDSKGITPLSLSKYNKDWPFLQNWLQSKRIELERQRLKEKHHISNLDMVNLKNEAL